MDSQQVIIIALQQRIKQLHAANKALLAEVEELKAEGEELKKTLSADLKEITSAPEVKERKRNNK